VNAEIIQVTDSILISPFGGTLRNLIVPNLELADLSARAEALPSVALSQRSVCDLELLATGAFSPLDRFMSQSDYRSVLDSMRLSSGQLFPIPITLPIQRDVEIRLGSELTLRDVKLNPLAIMTVDEVYEWDRAEYAKKVLGTESLRHPQVTEMATWGDRFVSGPIRVLRLPRYYDFPELRLSPAAVRDRLRDLGNPNVVAFQTRNPLHRSHETMIQRALEQTDGVLLLHPVVGPTKPGDVDYHNRVRTYKVLAERCFPPKRVLLSLLPLAMRLAGPREALLHTIIRRNFGANHFIVGRDHASPGVDENGAAFYEPYAARELVEQHAAELEMKIIAFEEFVYLPGSDAYEERSKVASGDEFIPLSGTTVREQYLNVGKPLPDWFVRREVAEILEESVPPRFKQGVCLWFTGLSGAGKSTIAEIVTSMLTATGRQVTLLDGDVVRANLSAGLGFDRAGRDANIRRIGFVAGEIVRHRGVAICAAISPYRTTRNEVRKSIGENFIEIYVSTPIDVCESRDPKGLYARARRGELKDFTGIDDVYEEPHSAELRFDTIDQSAEEIASSIIEYLTERGYIKKPMETHTHG
jgi:sulfate adenylyltransferase